ncbi:hypothetical protein [Pseudomonas serboccidentalis]|uniref:hypothetical protein n=1 Tax=Pseudomonas serboccidentalis TaxID=2964670 RepID=UPI0039DF7D28
MTDSVEKLALSLGLVQNLLTGQQEITQHDGTVIERVESAVLLVQPRRSHPVAANAEMTRLPKYS